MSEFPLLSPRPESGFTDSLQVVGSEGQLGRRRRHGPEETRQQCIENSREHVDDGGRGTLSSNPPSHLFCRRCCRRRCRCCCLFGWSCLHGSVLECVSPPARFPALSTHNRPVAVTQHMVNPGLCRRLDLEGKKKTLWHYGKCSSTASLHCQQGK